jgi:hypothetical protein
MVALRYQVMQREMRLLVLSRPVHVFVLEPETRVVTQNGSE